jgi:transcriptional regulator with XRE-family HTH domain
VTGPDRVARQVGNTVRRLRRQRAATQRQVAASADILPSELSAYERGQQLPSALALGRLLEVLACSEERFARHFGPFGEVGAIRRRGAL